MGRAVTFDGTADYIDFGHPADLRLTSSMTISAWIKSTSFPQDDAAIVSSRSNGVGFQLDTTIDKGPRTIGFKLGSSCGTTTARYGATPLALDTWYYVTGVYDADAKTMDVYLNGKLDNGFLLGPVEGMQKSSRKNVYAGRGSKSDLFGFAGEIDDVRIYSLPLTEAEIAADMRGAVHNSAPQRAATAISGRAPPRPEDRKEACLGPPIPEIQNSPARRRPWRICGDRVRWVVSSESGPLSCLIASLLAGLSFVPATASTLPGSTRWMMLSAWREAPP